MKIPKKMKAFCLTSHGGLEALVYRDDVPVPAPLEHEVLIEVRACGMNNTDINTRTGWYAKSVEGATGEQVIGPGSDGSWGGGLDFPRIQGADVVGYIVSVGTSVDPDRIGQRVLVDPWIRDPSGALDKASYLGSERNGGYAQYVNTPAVNAHRIESALSDEELASFPCSYSTAENMLTRVGVSSGQVVLVTGSSGGVGGALIQLSKRRGAEVIALTSGSKIEAVKELGADHVLDRDSSDLVSAIRNISGGVDVFADVVGGALFSPLLETLRPGGSYTTAGAIGGPIVSLDLRTVYLNDLTFYGVTVVPETVFRNLVKYIERGEVRAIVAGIFPLSDMPAAQQAFMEKDHVGTYVIKIE